MESYGKLYVRVLLIMLDWNDTELQNIQKRIVEL